MDRDRLMAADVHRIEVDTRFSRFESIQWWDQSRLAGARIMVVGAGALGNEVIKNLSLLGVGNLVIADMDHVETSNLSRSVLFRESDRGRPKAECAARAARELYPELRVEPIVGNIMADVGLGYFHWAQCIVGALDNREARVFVNAVCARLGRPWIDGGIEVLQGIVRGFSPPETACYECTMSKVDWDLLNKRRSCALLARRAIEHSGTPTTPTTASVIAGIQAQEVVKLLHGMPFLAGRGFLFEGLAHQSYSIAYQIDPSCGWHDAPPRIERPEGIGPESRLRVIWDWAAARFGGLDAIDLGREIVRELECPACGERETLLLPVDKIPHARVMCGCGSERAPIFFHSISNGSGLLDKTTRELGLPAWEIVWARKGDECLGIEIGRDPSSRFEINALE